MSFPRRGLILLGIVLGCDGFTPSATPSMLPARFMGPAGAGPFCPTAERRRLPLKFKTARKMSISDHSYSHVSMQLDFMDKLGKMGLRFGASNTMEEIDPQTFSFSTTAKNMPGVAAESSEPGVSGGKPKANQDTTLIQPDLYDGISMYAVFDGHGSYGGEVAEWIRQTLPASINSALYRSDPRVSVAQRISKAFEEADEELAKTFGDAVIESGCTGTVVLQKGDKIVVSHLGDSRAILGGIGNRYTAITIDHSPALPAERARIEAAGGEVGVLPGELPIEESGDGRVFVAGMNGPALNTARAFGDTTAKSVGVTAVPDQRVISLTSMDKCIIIASDGVWDAMDEQTAVETVMQYAKDRDADMAATVLVQACRLVWEAKPSGSIVVDDISAVVIFF